MDFTPLLSAPLFRDLTFDEIKSIFTKIPFQVKKYNTGTMVARCGEEVKSLMIVLNGVVKGEMVDYSGRVIKIEEMQASHALAAAFLFGKKNFYPVNVVAVTDASLLIINKTEFLKLLTGDKRILINFLDMVSNRSQFLSEKIKFLNFKTIRGKLAQFILQKTGSGRNAITLDMTQNDLADFFGVARPSVARALGEMEEEGIIEVKAKNIRIIDRKRLRLLTINS